MTPLRTLPPTALLFGSLALLLGATLAAPAASAQAPATMSYQGYVEENGAPVNGTRTLRFRLYDVPTGGIAYWTETRQNVPVAGGVFSVTLGTADPLPTWAFSRPLWLDVTVAGTVLSPRTALAAVPYAMGLAGPVNVVAERGGSAVLAVENTAVGGRGLEARAGASGSTTGVLGRSTSSNGTGVKGEATAATGETYGVYGYNASSSGRAVYGRAAATTGVAYGGYFETASTSGRAVYGVATATGFSVGYGVFGKTEGSSGVGVTGHAAASSGNTIGVYGISSSTTGTGVYGWTNHPSGNTRAVYGFASSPSGYAGYFAGRAHVTGTLSKGGGSFVIDHPLDPEGRVLRHSFVESPDMMNVYNGNATTDAEGYATVVLPAWFEALNHDFRYQLTTIGSFSRAMIAEEIEGGRFVIRTEEPGVRVSWLVTGIRRDAWAEENRIVVEEEKPAEQRGRYLHPSAFGLPRERGVDHDPEREDFDEARRALPLNDGEAPGER